MAKKVFTDESLGTLVSEIKSYTDTSSAERATKGHGIYYGTCATAAATAAKVVTLTDATGFSLTTGTVVIVKFTYANSVANPTLNVNSTGAKSIMRYGTTAASTSSSTSGWVAGAVQILVYDGTNWVRDYWNNTTYANYSLGQGYGTCTTAEATTAKVVTLSNYALSAGGIVSVKFTYAVPASATMNINSKGAKNIYYRGAAITAGVIKAGDIATFMYDGTQYHLVAVDRWQEDINSKQATITGGATTITSSNLTASRALVSNSSGKVAVSDVTSTELGYLDGVTSNIQTQLNGKASSSHSHSAATTSAAGFMSASDKKILNCFTYDEDMPELMISNTISTIDINDDTLSMTADNGIYLTTSDALYVNNEAVVIESDLANYLPRTGGSINGSLSVKNAISTASTIQADTYSTYSSNAQLTITNTVAVINMIDDAIHMSVDDGLYVDNGGLYVYDEEVAVKSDIPDYITTGAKSGTTIGSCATAEGYSTTASASYSHAEGQGTTASGNSSHSEGFDTIASGIASHAEGESTDATGTGSHAEGYSTTASGAYSHAEGYSTTALGYQHAQGHHNNTTLSKAGTSSGTGSGTAFVIGNGTSSSKSNAFRVDYNGKPYSKSTLNSSGADYAEFFEWQDLNLNAEDRRGYFVTLDGDKIKIAEPNDYILGIISALPSVAGNGDEDWMGRYIFDEFGAFVYEDFEYEEKVFDEETGETKTIVKTGKKYKENPDYDPTLKYIQREDRPEWDYVGMLGVLSVRDDGTCKVNGYCKVAEGGIATESETGYRVIKRVNDNIVKVIFK